MEEIILNQVIYSKVSFDNGILIIKKRTGNSIHHKNVPKSVFDGFKITGNSDSYYETNIKHTYPVF